MNRMVIAAIVFVLVGLLAWQVHTAGVVQGEANRALADVRRVQDSLVKERDSLLTEVGRYKADSTKAADRVRLTRKSTDSSLVFVQVMDSALQGVVPDSLLETFRRGVATLASRITEERLHADNQLAIEAAARGTVLRLATVEGERVTATEIEMAVVTKKRPWYVRTLKATTRVALVGGGGFLGAAVGGPPGAALGAAAGALVPLK
jgi:hypothetical protein